MPKYTRYFLPLLLIILTSCSSLQQVSESNKDKVWQSNKKALTALKNQQTWTMLARIGTVSKQGSTSSELDWQNTTTGYNIKLNNMLTFGEIFIKKQNSNITLNYQDKTYSATNPESLLFELTQLNLPISEFQYWVLGLPSPNLKVNSLELNNYATIQSLSQDKFKVEYDNYDLIKQKPLPHKISIKTKGLYLKIVVQSWYI